MVAGIFLKVVWESQSEKITRQGPEYMERVSGDCLGKAHSRWQNRRRKGPEAGVGPACSRKNMEARVARAERTRLRVQVARAEPCEQRKGLQLWLQVRWDGFARTTLYSNRCLCSRTLVPFCTAKLHFPGSSGVRCDHMTKFCPMGSELA